MEAMVQGFYSSEKNPTAYILITLPYPPTMVSFAGIFPTSQPKVPLLFFNGMVCLQSPFWGISWVREVYLAKVNFWLRAWWHNVLSIVGQQLRAHWCSSAFSWTSLPLTYWNHYRTNSWTVVCWARPGVGRAGELMWTVLSFQRVFPSSGHFL